MADIEKKYSDEVLEETPSRVSKLLNAIGAVPEIRTLMAQGGMTNAEIAEGSKLLVGCWGHLPNPEREQDTEAAKKQRAATAELDQWDEPNFSRYAATLRRHHPSAGEYVFQDLSASAGAAAVAGVATFLNRVTALEEGSDPARRDSKKDDKKAVELLAERGLTKEERKRLSALVEVALEPTSTLAPEPEHDKKRKAERTKALVSLKDWFEEWATTARVLVKKRAYLIRMGLANRKKPKKDEPK